MSEYKVIREKLIKHKGVIVDARPDGTVHLQLHGQALTLSEAEISIVYSLLQDITEYVAGPPSESQIEKMTNEAEDE